MTRPRWNIAVVGAGRVGQVWGKLLVRSGDRVVAVVSRSLASAKAGGKFLRCTNVGTEVGIIPPETDLILLTTPHGAIAATAEALAALPHLRFRKLAVCHASGMLTAEVLAPLATKGAVVFSFHPLQTFPRDFAPAEILDSAVGIWYGVDGLPRGITRARALARRLGGHVVLIPPERRAYYHAACVVASNHLTAMAAVLEEMHAALGLGKTRFTDLFAPIVAATLRNIVAASPARALSGPVARGGAETVEGHFRDVAAISPQLLPYYAAMTRETVRLAVRKGSIDAAAEQRLLDVVGRFEHFSSEDSR